MAAFYIFNDQYRFFLLNFKCLVKLSCFINLFIYQTKYKLSLVEIFFADMIYKLNFRSVLMNVLKKSIFLASVLLATQLAQLQEAIPVSAGEDKGYGGSGIYTVS